MAEASTPMLPRCSSSLNLIGRTDIAASSHRDGSRKLRGVVVYPLVIRDGSHGGAALKSDGSSVPSVS